MSCLWYVVLVSFYTSEMNTHSYIPFLFSINLLCHLFFLICVRRKSYFSCLTLGFPPIHSNSVYNIATFFPPKVLTAMTLMIIEAIGKGPTVIIVISYRNSHYSSNYIRIFFKFPIEM